MRWGEDLKENSLSLEFSIKDSNQNEHKEHLSIPAFYSEYEDVMHKLRVKDIDMNQTEIRIASCQNSPGLWCAIIKNASDEELNFFAERVKRLSAEQGYALSGVYKIGRKNGLYKDEIEIRELINMTYELDKVYVMPGIDSDKEFGEALICAQSEEYMENMTEEELNALDSEKVGREHREKENGTYINNTYVSIGNYQLPKVYDGNTLPDEKYPDYRLGVIQLIVTGTLTASQSYLTNKAVWITLPINRAECDRIAHSFGKSSIGECTICAVKSAIPEIKMSMLSNTASFDALNKLALAYMNMSSEDKIKYKAILEREIPNSAEKAIELIDDIPRYELDTEVFDRGDYTRKYFSKMLPEGFNVDFIKEREFKMIGTRLMHELELFKTSYGFISQKDRSLYEIVREQSQEETEEIEMGGMQM